MRNSAYALTDDAFDKGASPRISVIIPVYNVEPYIARCIESLQAQTFKDLEFVFVDDRGTDGSMTAVEAWAAEDGRVRILRNERNLGPGPSRNRGIEAAQGDYLSFVDPDDWVSPDFYELLYAAATAGGGHDIAKCRCCWVDAESGEVGPAINVQNDGIRNGLAAGRPLYCLLSHEHWTCLWKRELFDNPDVRYGTSVTSQDTTFILRACYQTNDIVFEDEALYFYVQVPHSATHRSLVKRTHGELDSLAERIAFFQNQELDEWVIFYLKSSTATVLRRFQAAMGSGSVSRDMIPYVVKRLEEMLLQGSTLQAGDRDMRKLAKAIPDHRLFTPGLRSPGEGEVRVSVVLPVYDVGPHIGKCVESLRSQLLDGLEFVFVDDRGTDGSMAAVEAWAAQDSRVRILRNERNLGAGPSRNRGIEAARGDYLSFVDPDDWVSPDFYELLYAAATAGGGHDIAKGLREVELAGGRRARAASRKANRRIARAAGSGEPLFAALTGEHATALYRRALFEAGARYGTSRGGEGATFLLAATLLTDDAVIEEGAVYHRVWREGSAVGGAGLGRCLGELDALAEQAGLLEGMAADRYARAYLLGRANACLSRCYFGLAAGPAPVGEVDAYAARLGQVVEDVPSLRFLRRESVPCRALLEHHVLLPAAGSVPDGREEEAARAWVGFVAGHRDAGWRYLGECAASIAFAVSRGPGGHRSAYSRLVAETGALPPWQRAVVLLELHRRLASGHNLRGAVRRLRDTARGASAESKGFR